MNKSRRKELSKVIKIMTGLKNMKPNPEICSLLQEAEKTLEEVTDEEQMAYDSLPENLMLSAKADAFSDNLSNLWDAQADLGLVVEAFDNPNGNGYSDCQAEVASVILNCTEAIERR